jgi:hypothetical protein
MKCKHGQQLTAGRERPKNEHCAAVNSIYQSSPCCFVERLCNSLRLPNTLLLQGLEYSNLAVTGWGQEEDRTRAFAAGFDHHLVKPVTGPALEAVLQSVGRVRSSSRSEPMSATDDR